MIKEQLRNILILIVLVVIGITINMVFISKDPMCLDDNEVFISKDSVCPDDYVDWSIAVTALSHHFIDLSKKNPDIDFGPADIKQHFAENCEDDLKIYDEYIDNYSNWVKN